MGQAKKRHWLLTFVKEEQGTVSACHAQTAMNEARPVLLIQADIQPPPRVSPARLEEAVLAYKAALSERRREVTPLEWATTQDNLGMALLELGLRKGNTALLAKAVAAHWEALKEYLRDTAPFVWAQKQDKLANALHNLGERTRNVTPLEESVQAHREALAVCEEAQRPLEVALTRYNLGIALQFIGEIESSSDHLVEADATFRSLLTDAVHQSNPMIWTDGKRALQRTENLLASRKVLG